MKKFISILILVCLVISVTAQNFDVRLLDAINSPTAQPVDGLMKTLSKTNSVVLIGVPVTLAVTGFARHDKVMIRNACVIVAASALNAGVTFALKYSINRTRPFNEYPNIIHNKLGAGDPSFPSGHSSSAFATATSLSLAYPKWYVIAPSFIWAGSVAYSRLHLGVHYPSDVLVGILIGIGSSYLSYKANIWLTKKYPNFGN